jgi:hypothetical protein
MIALAGRIRNFVWLRRSGQVRIDPGAIILREAKDPNCRFESLLNLQSKIFNLLAPRDSQRLLFRTSGPSL